MSYKHTDDTVTDITNKSADQFANALLYRKEFYQFSEDESVDYRDPNEYDALRDKYLKLRAHQLFAQNFLNPHTPYKRLIMKWKPGTGKTAGAICIAQTFISMYNQYYRQRILTMGASRKTYAVADKTTPSVFVIGFTKLNIIKELLKYPEFGFISIVEREELTRLQELSVENKANLQAYKEYLMRLKRRITSKVKGGFYKFYGYQEFVNRLFISDSVDLVALENAAMKSAEIGSATSSLEQVITEHIAAGTIQINVELMKQFDNSLLICDEIHDTYNQHMKNNYGVAIQYVLDTHPDLRAIFLTATPMNNSPTEVVDILNYVLPLGLKLNKKELFGPGFDGIVSDEVLDRIGKLSAGRISFVQDINERYYPNVSTDGIVRQLRHKVGQFSTIPYLTFHVCEMSPLHLATYKDFLANTRQLATEGTTTDAEGPIDNTSISLPADSYTIIDMCFPNPRNDKIGLYKSAETKVELASASNEWKQKNKVRVSTVGNLFNISGEWLHMSNVGQYSAKLFELGKAIEESFERSRARLRESASDESFVPYIAGEKMLVYHERVRSSGVLLISAFMRENNIIDEFSEPVDGTRCAICGGSMGNHVEYVASEGLAKHMYYPCRFVSAHSEVEKTSMLASLERYNSGDNSYGTRFKFLVGSKIIRQSYDIKDTEYMVIMSLPIHISGLIQLRGRVERHGSHLGLPQNRRNVTFSYYITTIPDSETSIDGVSLEEYRYVDKLSAYMQIQRIEKYFHEYAIDGPLMHVRDRRERTEELSLMPLNFKPLIKLEPKTTDQLNLDTFWSRGHGKKEIAVISQIIKRLFMTTSAYTYDTLFEAVKAPPFGVEVNPKLFDEKNFAIALDMLVRFDIAYTDTAFEEELGHRNMAIAEKLIVNMLFDQGSRYIYKNMIKHKIEQIGEWYILFQMVPDSSSTSSGSRVIKDIESFIRTPTTTTNIRINIDKWLAENKVEYNYEVAKKKFINEYLGNDGDAPPLQSMIGRYDPTFYRHLFTDIIVSSFVETNIEVSKLYKRIINLYSQFNAIVFIKDIIKYKDTAKKFIDGTIVVYDDNTKKYSSNYPTTMPIGFIDIDSISAYDGKQWIKINKAALNLRTQFKENDAVVGYHDILAMQTQPKFKIRRSMQSIKSTAQVKTVGKAVDSRVFERGIVCQTKTKPQLLGVINDLKLVSSAGIVKMIDSSQRKHVRDLKINDICELILGRLIELEIRERARDSDKKYYYMWYETPQ